MPSLCTQKFPSIAETDGQVPVKAILRENVARGRQVVWLNQRIGELKFSQQRLQWVDAWLSEWVQHKKKSSVLQEASKKGLVKIMCSTGPASDLGAAFVQQPRSVTNALLFAKQSY